MTTETNDTEPDETEHTVEIEISTLVGDSDTIKLSPGEEEEIMAGTVAFTVRAVDTETEQ